jgi:hypothetical protein
MGIRFARHTASEILREVPHLPYENNLEQTSCMAISLMRFAMDEESLLAVI